MFTANVKEKTIGKNNNLIQTRGGQMRLVKVSKQQDLMTIVNTFTSVIALLLFFTVTSQAAQQRSYSKKTNAAFKACRNEVKDDY